MDAVKQAGITNISIVTQPPTKDGEVAGYGRVFPSEKNLSLFFLDQPDGIGSPFAQSTILHVLIFAGLIGYGYVHNLLHGSEWGANSFQQGAIQATLVSTAALPLPQRSPAHR